MIATATTIRPTDEQEHAIAALAAGVRRGERVQTLGGYAGTGKTSVIKLLVDELPGFAVCAFTGKAACVLRRKGVDASTIHGLIYEVHEDGVTGKVTFRRRPWLPCRGIIVDEASMVARDVHDDLLRFGLPVVFVGDHGQLEPVNSDFNLMKDPDHRLETIHRNAGMISRFAEWLRKGKDATRFPGLSSPGDDQVELIRGADIARRELWRDADQMICAYNRTRVRLNAAMRLHLGHAAPVVGTGERVICLRNDRDRGLYNGQQGTVLDYRHEDGEHLMGFETADRAYWNISIDPDQFGREKTIPRDPGDRTKDRNPFDYAYCVTCHKAQGDEFDTVIVFEQRCSAWDHRRWAYTAASRARRKLYWVAAG